MKKKLFLLFILLLSISTHAQLLLVDDGDFESPISTINQTYSYRKGININSTNCGNLISNWGSPFSYSNTIGGSNNTPINDLNSPVSLVTQGEDETLLQYGIHLQKVLSGNRAMRLNEKIFNPNVGHSEITGLRKTYTKAKKFISFDFSIVGQVHSQSLSTSKEAFFSVRLIDSNQNIIAQNCYITNTAIPFYSFYNGNTGYYVNWKKFEMQVPSNYIGKTLRLEIITSGCAEAGHFQVMYLDNIKNTDEHQSTGCEVKVDKASLNSQTNKYEICGTYDEPTGGVLLNLILTVYKNGQEYNLPIAITPTFNGNQYCYEIPFNFLTLPGNYSFEVTGYFNDNINFKGTVCSDTKDLLPQIEISPCSVDMQYIEDYCNTNIIKVCGSYGIPVNATVQSISLNIYENNNFYSTLLTNTSNTLGQYCFTFDTTSLQINAAYKFEIIITYLYNDNLTTQVCKNEYNIPRFYRNYTDHSDFNYATNNGILSWNEFSTIYTHQIVYDRQCLDDPVPAIAQGQTYQFTTLTNSISLSTLKQLALQHTSGSHNVRWRVYLGCNVWSEWCCIQFPQSPFITTNCVQVLGEPYLAAYPNPTQNTVSINNNNYSYYEIFNTKGEKIKSKTINPDDFEIKIDLSNQKEDIYIITLDSKESIKVIKN
ncbi:T9SS type A sorting domain-containing protein [Paenimyroides ceti]